MGKIHRDDVLQRATARTGPAVVRFAEWASVDLWRRLKECAVAEGCTPFEAEQVTQLAVKACIKAVAGGIHQAQFERQFRRGN